MSDLVASAPLLKLLHVRQTSPARFAAELTLQHCFAKVAHGGATAVLAANAAREYLRSAAKPHHVFNLNIVYLRQLGPGDVDISVEPVRLGKNVSVVGFAIAQDGRDVARGEMSAIDMDSESGVILDTAFELHPRPVAADVRKLADNSDASWIRWTTSSHPSQMLQAWSGIHFFAPRYGPVHPSIIDLWCTPASEHESFTDESLFFLADNFVRPLENFRPSSTFTGLGVVIAAETAADDGFTIGYPTDAPSPWVYPTHSLTLEVKRRLPPEGIKWVFLRAQTSLVRNGRFDVKVTILDEHGEILAISSQACFVIDTTQKRRGKL